MKENAMMILLAKYLEIYCQVQTKASIILFKVPRIIGT